MLLPDITHVLSAARGFLPAPLYSFLLSIYPLADSIMGEVLLYSIKKCIGSIEYNQVVHSGWAKIYSAILDVIIPEAVRFELSHKEQCEAIAIKRASHHINSDMPIFTSRRLVHDVSAHSTIRVAEPTLRIAEPMEANREKE
jgi:hypothetical protein